MKDIHPALRPLGAFVPQFDEVMAAQVVGGNAAVLAGNCVDIAEDVQRSEAGGRGSNGSVGQVNGVVPDPDVHIRAFDFQSVVPAMRNEVVVDVAVPGRKSRIAEVVGVSHPVVEHVIHVRINLVEPDHMSALAVPENDTLHALIGEFRAEAEERAPGYRHRVRSICTEMIVLLARKIGQSSEARPSRRPPRAEPLGNAAREYIVKHFARDLTLGEIAWHVGKGEEHLARQFKRRTGQSVFDYVREVRIAHAKTLLSAPALTLTEIAGRCGFHSLSFFSRTFRACTGMPPSRYRGQLQTELQSKAAADQDRRGRRQESWKRDSRIA